MVPKPMTIGDNDETHDVPLLRNRQGLNDVVNDGNECAVIEERDKHQHEHRELEKKKLGRDSRETFSCRLFARIWGQGRCAELALRLLCNHQVPGSPVIIFTATPYLWQSTMVFLVSGAGGRGR